MLSFVAFALGSKVGRYLVAAVLTAATIALAVARVFKKGQEYERGKDNETKIIQLENAIRANEEVDKLTRVDRLDYLNGWLRNE